MITSVTTIRWNLWYSVPRLRIKFLPFCPLRDSGVYIVEYSPPGGGGNKIKGKIVGEKNQRAGEKGKGKKRQEKSKKVEKKKKKKKKRREKRKEGSKE